MSGLRWKIMHQLYKTIGSLHVRNTYNVTIIAILKKNMKKFFNPGPDSIIEAGDMLVLSGERHEVKRIINELLSVGGIHNRWIL